VKFTQLYSGSSGNLYIVEAANGKRLMLECGVTWNKLQKALDFNLKGIEGCFVTHSHADHSKAVSGVINAGINVFASSGTYNALGTQSTRAKIVEDKTLVKLDTFQVLCFDTHHDCQEPLGFVVREIETNEYLLFATDTSYISQLFSFAFAIVAIECSFDRETVVFRLTASDEELKKAGLPRINESLAKRLLDSHFEKNNAMYFLQHFCDLSKCRQINLLHLSSDNIDKEKTRKEFEDTFFIETVTI